MEQCRICGMNGQMELSIPRNLSIDIGQVLKKFHVSCIFSN
jgi:hypothetical protein